MGVPIDLDIKIGGKGSFHVAQDATTGKVYVSDVKYQPGPSTHEPDIHFTVEETRSKQSIKGVWQDGQKEPVVTGTLPGPANSSVEVAELRQWQREARQLLVNIVGDEHYFGSAHEGIEAAREFLAQDQPAGVLPPAGSQQ